MFHDQLQQDTHILAILVDQKHCFKVRSNALSYTRVCSVFNSGSAFHQIPQSYLNDVHLVPSVVLTDNELLTKVPMDIDT